MKRYPCVRQMDEADCGAACLATVAASYGRQASVVGLREAAGTGRSGVNLLGLREAAVQLGFEARGVSVSDRSIVGELPAPWIAHVRRDEQFHFLVVHRVKGSRVVVADPAVGLRRLTPREFDEIWTGHALLLSPAGDFSTEEFKKHSPLGRILKLALPFRSLFLHAILAGLLLMALTLTLSLSQRYLFDEVLPNQRIHTLHLFGAGMVVVVLLTAVFGFLRTYLLTYLGQKVGLHLTAITYRRMLHLPMSYFTARRSGEIIRRLSDVGGVQRAVTGLSLGFILDILAVLAAGATLLVYDWRLALLLLGAGPIFLALSASLVRPVRSRFRTVLEQGADIHAQIVETLRGIDVVKTYGAEEGVFRRLEVPLVRQAQEARRTALLQLTGETLSGLVQSLVMVLVFWIGGAFVIQGTFTLGQVVLFLSMAGFILTPLRNLAGLSVELQDALVALERLSDVLDATEEPLRRGGAVEEKALTGAFEVEDVRFAYGYDEEVLRGISFRCAAGEWVGLVGESGAGKSTLFRLFQGFFATKSGRIRYDGHDLRDLSLRSLRRQVALVEQECQIFGGTLQDNLRLARPDASIDEVVEACRLAGAEAFIEKLPQRYRTVVGERGVGLSGGERQRLALARALLARPAILLLDEATAHLDPRLEREILGRLREGIAGRTVLFCTHRLTSVPYADRILVMDKGIIVEQGTHRELLEREGLYATLWARQGGELGRPEAGGRLRGTSGEAEQWTSKA